MEYVIERGMRILPESSWRPVFQRSIDAFYEGRKSEGIDACIRLLQATGLPQEVRELTFRNQTYYAQSLQELVEGAHWWALDLPQTNGSVVGGPSPVLAGNRLMFMLCIAGDEAGPAASTALLTLDDDLNVVDVASVGDETGEAHSFHDPRPFFADGVLQAGVIIRPPQGHGFARAGVVDLVDGTWQNLRSFGPRAGHFQAGWSPLVIEAGVHFVSWWEPTEVFRFDAKTDEFERVALRMAPHVAERFQGGSQGVPVPGGYLFLVNEWVSFDEGSPLVFSRFVRVDGGFQITAISPQFSVAERGRDAASGLVRQYDRLVAGFFSTDREPLLATMDLEATLGALVPVDAPGRRASH